MASTSSLNIINLQSVAEDQIAIDQANGTYEANLAADEKYYLWQGDFQTIPSSMFGNPELYAARLRDALPEVTTIRLPFNAHSFDADGNLNEQTARFIVAAQAQGFNFILTLMDGDAQRFEVTGPDALEQTRNALTGAVYDNLEQTWTKMLDWIDENPAVGNAIYAYELVNEPAAYNTASLKTETRAEGLQEFVSLYAEHMVDLGQMIGARSENAKIMVGGWNYSANFQQLADITMGDGSALDYIRNGLGDSLVWSAHLYPGWLGTTGMSNPDDVRAMLDQIYSPILGDSFIITETNAQGNEAYNLMSDRKEVQGFTQAYDWFSDHGVAIGWFTGSQYGASNLSRMDPDGTLRFVQQASYAAAMDGFTLGDDNPDHAGAEVIDPVLIAAYLRNQTNDPDYIAGNEFDIARNLGLGVGHGGNDTLNGSALANNFLYGGTGNDQVLGNLYDDFLFGQDGDDALNGGPAGHDHLFGGRGNDRLTGGAGITQVYGGAGADLFVAHPRGQTILVDFSPTEGDQLIINERNYTPDDFRNQAVSVDYDAYGPPDLRVTLPSGGEVILIGMGDRLEEVVAALVPAEGNVDPVDPVTQDEVLQGRLGNDTLYGDAGNDTLYGDPAGGMGNDSLYGGTGNDLIYGVGGNDTLDGGDGNDSLYGDYGRDLLYGGLHNDLMEGGVDNDTLYGGNGNDTMRGDTGSDLMYGGGGADLMEGGDGTDLIGGDGGDDTIRSGNGADTVYGGNGADLIYGNESNDILYGEKHNDTLYGGGGLDQLYGGSENDLLFGEDSNDTLYGGNGDDALYGGSGVDQLNGGSGADSLYGDIGSDEIRGEDGDDVIYGGDMGDVLYGGAGIDFLYGDAGNDVLSGGAGADVVTGGGSSDTFIFALGDQSLRITDFSSRQGDVLSIDLALMGGDATINALNQRAVSTDAGLLIAFDTGDSILMNNFSGTLTDSTVDFF